MKVGKVHVGNLLAVLVIAAVSAVTALKVKEYQDAKNAEEFVDLPKVSGTVAGVLAASVLIGFLYLVFVQYGYFDLF